MPPLQRLAYALVLSVLGIVLVAFAKPTPKSDKAEKERFWILKVFGDKRFDVLFAGDSRTYRGINPDLVIPQGQAMTALNYGFSAGVFSNFYLTNLEQKLNKKANGGIIVLCTTPSSLCIHQDKQPEHLKTIQKTSPNSVRLRTSIPPKYFSLFEPLRIGEVVNAIRKPKEGYEEKFHDNGWVESSRYPEAIQEGLDSYKDFFKHNHFSSQRLDTLCNFVRKWKEQGVKVYAFRPPSSKEMEAVENEMSGYVEAEVRQQLEAAGAVWISLPAHLTFKSYDSSHLYGESAIKLSEALRIAIFETPAQTDK